MSFFPQVPQEPGHLSRVKGQPEIELCDQLCRSQWGKTEPLSPIRKAKMGQTCNVSATKKVRWNHSVICGLDSKVSIFRLKLHIGKITLKNPLLCMTAVYASLCKPCGFVNSLQSNWVGHHWDRLQERTQGKLVCCLRIQTLLLFEAAVYWGWDLPLEHTLSLLLFLSSFHVHSDLFHALRI